MGLKRRSGNRFSADIWPGFVDAMSALLLVLMFVLTIFMVVQFVLRETIDGQDQELDTLSAEIAGLADALGLERNTTARLRGNVDQLTATLEDTRRIGDQQAAQISALTVQSDAQVAQIAALSGQAADQATQIAGFEQQVASLLARNTDLATSLAQSQSRVVVLSDQTAALNDDVAAATAREKALQEQGRLLLADKTALEKANLVVISERQALQLALAQARDEIDAGVETARLAAAKREALEAMIADLQADLSGKAVSLADAIALLARTQTELAGSQGSLSDALAMVSTANSELAQTRGALGKTQAELDAERAARAAVLAKLAAAAQDATQQGASLTQTQTELSQAQAELTLAQAELSQTRADLAAMQSDLAGLQGELTKARGDLTKGQGDLTKSRGDLAKAQGELAERGLTEAQLRERLEALVNGLSETQKAKLAEAAAAAALREKLKGAQAELTAMTLSLEAQRKKAEDTLTLLAAAKTAVSAADLAAVEHLSEREKQAALLVVAQQQLRDERALSQEGARKVALLSQQTLALRKQLDQLQGLLDLANVSDSESKVQIQALGANLNIALARVAADQKKLAAEKEKLAMFEAAERKRLEEEAVDLKKFRSEFFGRLREVLGSREGVRIVGDRFVFSSEILFPAGSAVLGDQGKVEIGKVAGIILDVADQIPPEIDWVLRVDGHTDKVPVSGVGLYRDNWELSQARALSVVKYLISDLGVPPNRLAANGFGEFQPIAVGDSADALAQNRRIELKFTEK
jgi:chemotaxis protein MotB